MTQALRDLLRSETDHLHDAGLYKREVVFSRSGGMAAGGMVEGSLGHPVVNFTTQDYLGLSLDPQLQQAAIDAVNKYGVGLSSQRVMCGTLPIHKELEEWLRGFLKLPDAMVYSSGYMANIGLFAPLFGARDCIICDGGVHPSLAEGARLAGARLVTFRSDDPDDLEAILRRSRWARFRAIVTNGVHPFTGRISDLASICTLADKYDAMVVIDDAIGVGVLGERGRGSAEHAGVLERIDLITGTFSKALGGAAGGFIAGKREIIDWLRQKSSPYMFSAALPPAMAAIAMAAIQILESGNAPIAHLRDNVAMLFQGLIERKFRVLGGQHPLVVVEIGSYEILRETVNHLYDAGIYCHGLCYPVVPEGEGRVRLMVSALHSADQIQQTLKAFESAREIASFAVDGFAALASIDG